MVLTDRKVLDEVLAGPLVGLARGLPGEHFRRENERIASSAAKQPIIPRPAIEDVVARPTIEVVIAGAAEQLIISSAALHPVVACIPEQQVIAATTVHGIITIRAGDDSVAVAARHAGCKA